MFSMCSKATHRNPTNNLQHSTDGKQVKGGYLLRYKKQLLWSRWAEEWVVLHDDSTMAWFTEPGRSSPSGKILVKEAPEMLAIAQWTGQIPSRPPLPHGCQISQLIALGSRRKRSKVYWMLAKSEQEVSEWMAAIAKTLPPAPQIELVIDKPHLNNGVVRRPVVRIRPPTGSEIIARKNQNAMISNSKVKSDAAIAILQKSSTSDSHSRATLACCLPWGHGWGWVTLPNGVWSGGLTWSQCEDTFTLHALPTVHCTNVIEPPNFGGIYHTDVAGFDFHTTAGIEDIGGEDFDYAMDFGDFIF